MGGNYSPRRKPNPNSDPAVPITNTKKRTAAVATTKRKSGFEFCKVCKLNHDKGQRHKYFPNHKRSLSEYLNRFLSKLDDVRYFLDNPSPLRPEHVSRNRLWCVFCDIDVEELDSSFACGNAINHLAGADHLKNLKHFIWKYGGAMDHLDDFRILDDDVAKWEKKCETLKKEVALSGEGSHGPICVLSNDIQNEQNYGIVENFSNNSVYHRHENFLNAVMPLQYYTNEYQISQTGPNGVPYTCGASHTSTFSLPMEKDPEVFLQSSSGSTGNGSMRCSSLYRDTNKNFVSSGFIGDSVGGMMNGDSSYQGLQLLTEISSSSQGDVQGNVHSGAPPPWLDASEKSQTDNHRQLPSVSLISPSNKPGKSKKLNPKRVGAAWAERRKIEMEMERRGEIIKNCNDAEWLPNFGRVWQAGSRKESRKEYEMEKRKLPSVETQPEMPTDVQPYISKRMRRDVSK
ncbi:TITAN-like protein isoform X2 [Rhodamnia argentea]|uniref:TITAN-like protein isoform X2 n=1 Tax=Rhodamnia argentea TaxID=178133 RepID=A0A8B8Q586_9MYRT|nr:TITAN-like protein isoform X2 [Rhodamnia argentea]XP_030542252.1 TITAN-like protein isoform X2 [Rhodamnia argentea]